MATFTAVSFLFDDQSDIIAPYFAGIRRSADVVFQTSYSQTLSTSGVSVKLSIF